LHDEVAEVVGEIAEDKSPWYQRMFRGESVLEHRGMVYDPISEEWVPEAEDAIDLLGIPDWIAPSRPLLGSAEYGIELANREDVLAARMGYELEELGHGHQCVGNESRR
jgi:hypothetical protein